METTKTSAESVLQHHLQAIGNNDLDELMKDYTEHSELWTQDTEFVGLQAISAFFSYAFTLFPKGHTTLDIKKVTAKNTKVYITWTADSPVVTVPFATDSFEITDGKITWQSTAFQIVKK